MLILSIDSAGSGCGVCVWQDGEVLSFLEEKMSRGQDSRLVPMVQSVLAKAGGRFEALDRVAVTRGPGSFTGIRIGLAAARGIGLAASKPVIGIDRFSIHEAQHKTIGEDLLVVLDSRRAELYARSYPVSGSAGEARLVTAEEVALTRFSRVSGDAFDVLGDKMDAARFLPLAEPEVVTAASLASRARLGDPAFLPRPLYLRPPDVTCPKGASGCL